MSTMQKIIITVFHFLRLLSCHSNDLKNVIMIPNKYGILLSLVIYSASMVAQSTFDIFSYKTPNGFTLRESSGYLHYEKNEGKNYCQLFLYPASLGQNDIEKDFAKN
jgi:hypothetical protein